jgi:hypothetical protein
VTEIHRGIGWDDRERHLDVTAVTGYQPMTINIPSTDGSPLVTIHPDGTLTYGPNYQPDEAARTFWEALAAHMPAGSDPQVRAERDELRRVLGEVLAEFQFKTHPGRACLQSGHVGVETVEGWKRILFGGSRG